jgi:hypothetical protein
MDLSKLDQDLRGLNSDIYTISESLGNLITSFHSDNNEVQAAIIK